MHRRALLAAGGVLSAAACTPSLGMFDALAPRDGGVRRLIRDAAYGQAARQTLDVYAPAERSGALPVLIFFYGGSWRHGDKDDYEFLGAALAAQGFVVVIPNYRLVPDVRFPAFLDDCAQAVAWTHAHVSEAGGDAERMVLAGHSAGAYNALMLALDRRYVENVVSLRGAIGLAGPYDFLPFDVDATRDAFGSAPDPLQTQPIHFARAGAPPLLLLWGDEDTTVGPRNIESLAQAQRAAGGDVETKIYPGVDHVEIMLAISRPFRGRASVLADVTTFAQRVTR